MRRLLIRLLCAGPAFSSSSADAALTFTLSPEIPVGATADSLSVGDRITVDITLRNDGQQIRVLSASAVGYDPEVLAFRGGVSVSSVLSRVCVPTNKGFDCFGGIEQTLEQTLVEDVTNPLGPRVKLFSGEAGFPFSATGEHDVGVDGSPGGPQFRLVFEIVSAGRTTVDFGVHPEFGDFAAGPLVHTSENAALGLRSFVPEPSPALLIGAGLIVRASLRPRSRLAPRLAPASPSTGRLNDLKYLEERERIYFSR